MNLPFRQDTRRGRLSTTLGADVLALLRLKGSHRLNGDVAFQVEALSADGALDLDALVGTEATVAITAEGGPSYFSGVVTEASWAGVGEGGHRYDLTLRSWLHLAGLRRQQRIFHRKTVLEILAEVFAPYAQLGSPAAEITCDRSYAVLEYTVQYRESDADFARRLMERFGISHVVRMHSGGHTLIVTDVADHLEKLPGGKRPFRRTQTSHVTDEEHFRDWRQGCRVTTGAVRLTDYNFKTPLAAMEADRTGDASHAMGKLEAYDWPGDHLTQAGGRGVAATRLAAERGQAARVVALGDVASLHAGVRVQLTGDRIPGATGKLFTCLEAVHDYTAEGYVTTGGKAAEKDTYTGRYVLLPAAAPLAPEQKTPVPTVLGPQTAVVVGDGEIDCDEFGRILVRFHWDLAGAHSMRCRVSQNWAAQGWGGMVIPRIGMEVMVDFLDGDPDKPLVTGCVYNGKNTVPYALPGNKTRSTFRTNSHDGKGTATGFNELRFEDKAGEEEIYVHGQKDRNTKIENNQTERVNVNKVESVGHSKATEIDNFQDHIVGGDMRVFVGPSHRGKVTPADATPNDQGIGAVALGLGEPGGEVGSGDMVIEIERDLSESVGRDVQQHVDGNKAVFIGGKGGLVLGALAGLIAAGSSFMKKHGAAAGAPVGGFAGAVGGMVAAVPGMQGLFGKLLGGSGTLNVVVEKFRSDTIGIARTEQVGLYKNTIVGHTQSLSVGKKQVAVIGEDYDLEAKKSIFTRTVKHTQNATEKIVIGGPGGTIIIDAAGVTIKAKSIKLKSPSIDLSSGAPNEAQLASDKPYNQDCNKA